MRRRIDLSDKKLSLFNLVIKSLITSNVDENCVPINNISMNLNFYQKN